MIALVPSPASGSDGGTGNLPDHISPTAAKAYLACSLRFYFERVTGIPKKTTVALHLGKAVHAASQSFHLARWRGLDDSPESIAATFEEFFLSLERDEGPVSFKNEAHRTKAGLDGFRVVAAYLDSRQVPAGKPRAVEALLREEVPGLFVPLTDATHVVETDFRPVDFKSAAAMPDRTHAAFDHEIQLVSYQLLLEEATGDTPPSLDLVVLVKTKTPKIERVKIPPADARRKRRVVALLETAVRGIASGRFHPQPGMHCSWCKFRGECAAWLPEQAVERRAA